MDNFLIFKSNTTFRSNQVQTFLGNLPPEQQAQAKGLVAGASNVVTGVAGTAGGAVKGILDTAGNTVRFLYINSICPSFFPPN